LVATPDPPAHRCELCAQPLDGEHRHLLDLPTGELLCGCRACAVLFDDQTAGGRHYRLVPRRRVALPDFRLDGPLWAALGVPVDLAFFTSDGGETVARYPSPAGALRATVAQDSWQRLVAANPVLRTLADAVEALVVDRARGASEYWLLPLDDCYRLTALLREHWSGFGGGNRVWAEIESFFARIREVR
jgi:hypothetical protein